MSNTATAIRSNSGPSSKPSETAGINYRTLPHNEEAEQALLGALLVDNRALERVNEFLHGEHFFVDVHGRIYGAICKLNERGQNATPVTLKGYFEKDDALSNVGGAQYLTDLAASAISIINVGDYGKTIYDLYLRRCLITLGETVVNDAYEQEVDISAIDHIEAAEKQLFDLAQTGDIRGGFAKLSDSVALAIEQAEAAFNSDTHITGVTTGLRDLDGKLGGMHKSDLIILAARPSMGKTALAVNIAFKAARKYVESGGKEGAVTGFFSLEMSADQLATRILSDLTEISGDRIRRGDIQKTDFQKFAEASQIMSETPLFIDDTPALSINAVRTRARRLQRQHNLGMIVVDYLQLLRGAGTKQGQDNRVQEVSEITRGLKALAKELHVPVIALSQLSRSVENREDKRPQLADLRESGSIEQDADVVQFIYREQYYLEREEPTQRQNESDDKYFERLEKFKDRCAKAHNIAEIIIAKQRHGPIGNVRLFFDGNFTRFSDLDRVHD